VSCAATESDSILLVHAYVDAELDPANTFVMAWRIAAEPALAAERDRAEALRQLIHRVLPRQAAPPGLRARIEAAIGPARPRAQPSWRALAASIALAALVASGSTYVATGPRPADALADAMVSGHVRALMAAAPTEVVSTDRHTVKPWFNGRIPEAPRVVDLAADGYALVGGRLDVVGRKPMPTLVYRHRQHLISLTAAPAAGQRDPAQSPRAIGGYNVMLWHDQGVAYWAVSDLAGADLDEFARLFRTAPADQ
jgi:anti-sigma factor RsiW